MPRLLFITLMLGLVLPMGAMAQSQRLMDSPLADVDKEFPGLDLLPPGSELRDVSLPRYKDMKIDLLVTSPYMKVISRTELLGRKVNTYMYDARGNQVTRIFMEIASYFFDTNILVSKERIILKDDRLDARGTGITFDTKSEIGIVHGPVETILHAKALKQKK